MGTRDQKQDIDIDIAPPTAAPAVRAKGPKNGPTVAAAGPSQTAALSAMLREPLRQVGLAMQDRTNATKLWLAADHFKLMIREVVALTVAAKPDWGELVEELSTVLVASSKLGQLLITNNQSTVAMELAMVVGDLKKIVTPDVLNGAMVNDRAFDLPAITDADRITVARTAMQALQTQIKLLDAQKGSLDRNLALVICAPMPLHVSAMTDVLANISKPQRRAFNPEMQSLRASFEELAQVLSMAPRFRWHETFAQTFDAGNYLFTKIMGLAPVHSPFTGKVDPAKAVENLTTLSGTKTVEDVSSKTYEDPSGAVNGISIRIRHIYESRIKAIDNLKQDLSEPPAPESSLWATVLEIGVQAALAVASGGIANLATAAITKAVSKHVATNIASQALKEGRLLQLTNIDERVSNSAAYKVANGYAVAETMKELVSGTRGAVTQAVKERDATTSMRAQFLAAQRDALTTNRQNSEIHMTHLVAALSQLDLEALNELVIELNGVHSGAFDFQYDSSMKEWLNTRAKTYAAPLAGSADANLDNPRHEEKRHGEVPIDGVLEVGVALAADPGNKAVKLDYMTIRHAEPAAIRHFKKHPQALAATGLHRMYQFNFLGYLNRRADNWQLAGGDSMWVKLGVGRSEGLQTGTLSSRELGLLALYSTGSTLEQSNRYVRNDRRPFAARRDAAIAMARELIARCNHLDTSKLEG